MFFDVLVCFCYFLSETYCRLKKKLKTINKTKNWKRIGEINTSTKVISAKTNFLTKCNTNETK